MTMEVMELAQLQMRGAWCGAWSWEDDYGSNGVHLVANERYMVWSEGDCE